MNRWSFTYPHWTDVVVLLILLSGAFFLIWAF